MSIPADEMDKFRSRVVGRSIGEDTFEAYRLWIERFEDWYDGDEPSLRDLEDFDSLLYDPARDFYPWENTVGRPAPASYSYSSRNQAVSAVKMWVRRQYDKDIPEQPGDIVRGEEDAFDPTYLSRDRVRDVIHSADDACSCAGCEAALALSYDAILRASECAALSVSDVDLGEGEVSVTAKKKGRDSTLTLGADTVERLEEYLSVGPNSGALFRNSYGDSWTKWSWASHVLSHHVEEGSHAWGRHTPILHMLEAGSPFGDVYRRARHRNPDTTARYARYVDADVPSWATD